MNQAGIFTFVFAPVFGSVVAGIVLLSAGIIGRKFFIVLVTIGVVISLINSIIAMILLSRR
jgi:hypothetical protein